MEALKLKHILTLYAGGASNREIARQTDVAKATVDMYIKRLRESQIDILDALALKPEILLEKLTINRSANIGYRLPDYEADYIRYHRKGKARKTLKELWQEYRSNTPASELSLGYKAYTKGMDRFIKNLPEHLTEYALTNQWAPADVMMIDYSGDKMQITDSQTGEKIPVDIFVAVLANSGYIFCMATPHQRRDDWIDAQIEMMDFFGGATRHIFLDNSTSLVKVADKYDPVISPDYISFCEYYATMPVAVRPGESRDKALVENAVKQVQNSIQKTLDNRLFFTIEDLNREIAVELKKLNERKLTNRPDGVSRLDLYEQEKLLLTPLPPIPYEKSMIKKILKVQRDYLIRYKNRRYSVPASYVGKKVLVIIRPQHGTLDVLDIKTEERITSHYLMTDKQLTRIYPEHLPQAHRYVLMSAQELQQHIAQYGPHSKEMCALVVKHNHGEIARKLLQGMHSFHQRLGNKLFEQACQTVLKQPDPSFKKLRDHINNVIVDGIRQMSIKTKRLNTVRVEKKSDNIRGADYYKNTRGIK